MQTDQPLRLTGRRSSHFTRVAAIFAHELGLPFDLEAVADLQSFDTTHYGGHPALKIPTLHVGGSSIWGTENICRKLAEVAGRSNDPTVVLSEHVTADLARNAQELVWQCMTSQVQLVVGLVFGKLPSDNLLFAKATAGMQGSLAWLDEHLDAVLALLPAPRDISVFETSLYCLIEHLAFRPTVPPSPLPKLRAFAEAFSGRESAARTAYRFDAPNVRP